MPTNFFFDGVREPVVFAGGSRPDESGILLREATEQDRLVVQLSGCGVLSAFSQE